TCVLRFALFLFYCYGYLRDLHSFPTRRSSDLEVSGSERRREARGSAQTHLDSRPPPHRGAPVRVSGRDAHRATRPGPLDRASARSEEHTSELQSRENLVCRLLLEKKKKNNIKK